MSNNLQDNNKVEDTNKKLDDKTINKVFRRCLFATQTA